MAEPPASRMIQPRSGRDTLPASLEARYGIEVAELTELDLGVYRVGRRDGPDWVARIFAADRPWLAWLAAGWPGWAGLGRGCRGPARGAPRARPPPA